MREMKQEEARQSQKKQGRFRAGARAGGHTPSGGRNPWLRWEKIKKWVLGVVVAVLSAALQTTLLSRLPLPWLSPASPSLTLLCTLAAGFFLGEREGAIMGLMAGFFAEAATGEGIMLLPLLYTLCGYLVGWLSRDHLAHNLPSYLVWAAIGGVWEQAVRYVAAAIRTASLPPAVMLGRDLFPHLIMTLLFAPLIYGAYRGIIQRFIRT